MFKPSDICHLTSAIESGSIDMTAVIQLDRVTKRFGSQVVLDRVSLEAPAGSVFALSSARALEPGIYKTLRRGRTVIQADSSAKLYRPCTRCATPLCGLPTISAA